MLIPGWDSWRLPLTFGPFPYKILFIALSPPTWFVISMPDAWKAEKLSWVVFFLSSSWNLKSLLLEGKVYTLMAELGLVPFYDFWYVRACLAKYLLPWCWRVVPLCTNSYQQLHYDKYCDYPAIKASVYLLEAVLSPVSQLSSLDFISFYIVW